MANWLTISDFIDDVQLSGSTITAVQNSFTSQLAKYETNFLREVLGVKMYNELKAGLLADPIAAKWSNLKDGCDFTYTDGYDYHLRGLKEALKYYSYVMYQKSVLTTSTIQANVTKKSDIVTIAEPTNKIVDAINKCIDLLEEIDFYVSWKSDDYPNFIFTNPFANRVNQLAI